MQIICIYSGVSPFEQKLDYVFTVFKNTLNEIGVKVDTLDITKIDIGYYNGMKQPIVENIFSHLKKAQGIIFATTAQRFSVNGAMQVFLEQFDYNLYKDILKEKPCLSIITSSDDSEYMAGNYMNTLIGALGGININNMLIGKDYLANIEIDEDAKEMIEKYAEDYYRMVKQNRKFFTASPFKKKVEKPKENKIGIDNQNDIFITDNILEDNNKNKKLSSVQVADLYKKEVENNADRQFLNNMSNNMTQKINQNNVNELLKQYKGQAPLNNTQQYNAQNYNNQQYNTQQYNIKQYGIDENNNVNFDSNQYQGQSFGQHPLEDDIDKIAKLLGQKYEEENSKQQQLNDYVKFNKSSNISASINTLRQKTESLQHYFQPQLASGMDIVIQVNVSGKETFSGFFVIKNGECVYNEGVYVSADVTIISDSTVWEEVLNAKCTLQKAFMLGRLKVKGNFVIISKFEQFFKIM